MTVATPPQPAEAETRPDRPHNVPFNKRPKLVIIGGGFAGLSAAKTLRNADMDITVIDRTNHFVFQPLLYQVAMAALAPSDITAPIRAILRSQKNTSVLLGEVKKIDPENRLVIFGDGDDRREIPYDYLILTTGAKHSYFGHNEWEAYAPGLKTIGDAQEIRQQFLLAFEEAEKATDPNERSRWMTFVLVGGGPTGCELAGVMPDIARRVLRPDFRNIDVNDTKVILVEAGPRILPTFPEDLAARAKKDLESFGVEVRTGDAVTEINENSVVLKSGARIETRTVVWAAGNAGSPLAKDLGGPLDKAGRVQVNPDLSVPGHPEVFVAGDLAAVTQKNGKPVPGVAQGAIQGGRHAANGVLHRSRDEATTPFNYWDKGNLAVLGRTRAIADLNFLHVGGFIAWAIWLFIHILYLVGFRNRLSVLLQWGYLFFTRQLGTRIIEEREQRSLGMTANTPASATPWGG
ncbi:MAG: NAD(P)/FAD-dependent oxidoreductase [Cytophagales bacterium]|nr:NAD(P)/FAD-dependent oxidoreductase [Armatimonadota bacterium]